AEGDGNANFEFLLGFLASFAKNLPTCKEQEAVLFKLSGDYPLVKKHDDKLMRQAWAEEEAKVQRSMVSYVLLRARKSDKTRANLPNMEILKEIVKAARPRKQAQKSKKEEHEDEEDKLPMEGEEQEDGEEEEDMEIDDEAEDDEGQEATGSKEASGKDDDDSKVPKAAKEEDCKIKDDEKAAEEKLEKNEVLEAEDDEGSKPKKTEPSKSSGKDSEKEEGPMAKDKDSEPKKNETSRSSGKDSEKEEGPKAEDKDSKPKKKETSAGSGKDSKKETGEEDGPKEPKRVVVDTGTDSQLPPSESFLEESLETFKKEADREAKGMVLDEEDQVQKNNGAFGDRRPLCDLPGSFEEQAAAFLVALNIEAEKNGPAGPDAANIIKAQQATRAMLRRANNNHEPGEGSELSEEAKDMAKKGKGKGRPKGKAKAKAKSKAKAKAKGKAKAKPKPDEDDDDDDDASGSDEEEDEPPPKKRGRSPEKKNRARASSPEEAPAKRGRKDKARSSKPAPKRVTESPNPESIYHSSEDEAKGWKMTKNKKLKPLKRTKSEEEFLRMTSEEDDKTGEEEEDGEEEDEAEDPTKPTIYPAGPPRSKKEQVLSEDLRQRRMEMLDILRKAEKQFAMPPHEKLKVLTCFTLCPPRQGTHEDSNECSKIQVILVGPQFYVKDADEDLMHEVNHIYDTCFKDLKLLDLFCGRGALYKAFCQDGQKRTGFLNAGRLCLRLMEDSLLSAGLPCTSYVWINQATHGRSESKPYGNSEYGYVRRANTWPPCTLWNFVL
ncbi:unnamed protein product, partial [Symbiodinium microadriaticum]